MLSISRRSQISFVNRIGQRRPWIGETVITNIATALGAGSSLRLYTPISDDDHTLDDLAKQLDEIGPNGSLDVYMNADGGDPFTGLAIYSLLSRHQGNVTAYIDGLARGPAAVVCMAADTIIASPSAHLVLENSVAMTFGNRHAHEAAARVLQKIDSTTAELFARRVGNRHVATFAKMMDDTTWLTAAEAKQHGLVDRVESHSRGNVSANIASRMATFDYHEARDRYGECSRPAVVARLRLIETNARLN
jgi:ATP-dependent protease ClpP protease subunit